MKVMKVMKDMKEGMKESLGSGHQAAADPTAKPERHPFMSFIRFMPFR
jgi:hypothetical protein